MTTYKVGGVAGAALFLSRFQAKQLAYADIASALVVALVVAGYVLLARRVPLLGLLLASTLFFASNCALFWALAHYHFHLSFLFPVFYIWVKIFGVLLPTQIWSGAAPSRVGSFPAISPKPWPGTSALRVCCWGWHCFC